MDTVSTPETPSARRTSKVLRNLLPEFANSTDLQVCDTPEVNINVTTPVRPETELSFCEVENNTGWMGFVTYWILLVICASVIVGFYHSFPTHLEIQVTWEWIPTC
jgi:hypothetical protein